MRTQFVLSLAVGFVAASPCKPLTSLATEASLTSSATEAIESTPIETAVVVETSVTETFPSTIADTTSSDAILATLTTASSDTTTLLTVDTSATETFTSSVGDSTSNELTSTTITASSADRTTLFTTETLAEMSTTTTEAAEPTGFFIIAGESPALGQKLQSSRFPGSAVSFNPTRGSQFEARRFTVDDSTGVLANEGTPMCAFFNTWDRDQARVSLCSEENHAKGTSYIICDRSPSPGDVLHCDAVKLSCWQTGPGSNQACEEVEDPLWNNQFFIQRNTVDSDDESTLLFGQDNLSETFTSPYSAIQKVDLFVNVATVSTPPP